MEHSITIQTSQEVSPDRSFAAGVTDDIEWGLTFGSDNWPVITYPKTEIVIPFSNEQATIMFAVWSMAEFATSGTVTARLKKNGEVLDEVTDTVGAFAGQESLFTQTDIIWYGTVESGDLISVEIENNSNGLVYQNYPGTGDVELIITLPEVVCTMNLLIGTDNGFIIRRSSENNYSVVFAGGGLGHLNEDDIFYDLQSTINDQRIVWANGGGLWYPAWSTNGGLNWDYAEDYATASPPYLDNPYNYGSFGGGGLRHERDNDGNVLGINHLPGLHNPDTNPLIFHRSIDHKGTEYEAVFNWELKTGQAVRSGQSYVADGYVWWSGGPTSMFTNRGDEGKLYRIGLDGEGFTSFNILPTGYGNVPITGWNDSHRLVIWQNLSAGPFISVDITDPDNPLLTHHFTEIDFETQFSEDYDVQHVQPITNQVILAMIHDPTDFDPRVPGAIIRSDDGGVTWDYVVNFTDQLGHSEYNNEYSNFGINISNPNEVFAVQAPPYVYHSLDAGETWEVETVDMDIFTPYGGDPPTEWSSIAVANTCIGGEPEEEELYPGLARYDDDNTSIIWFRTTFP